MTAPSARPWPRRGSQALVLRGEVAVLGAGRGQRGFFERDRRATWSPCGCGRSGVCRRIGRCRGSGRPRRRGAAAVGKTRHVGADLGDDDLGGARCDAGDRAEQLNAGRPERAELRPRSRPRAARSARRGSPGGRGSRRSRSAWWASKRPSSASRSAGIFARSRPLASSASTLRVGRAGDERVEHRAPGHAEDVGGDAVELDAGVLERLVQPVGLALALGDLRLAIARQRRAAADRLGRHEAAAQQARPPPAGTATARRRRRSCGPGPA